jgi:hypothetical protein
MVLNENTEKTLDDLFGGHITERMKLTEATFKKEENTLGNQLHAALAALRKPGLLTRHEIQWIMYSHDVAKYIHRGLLRTVGSIEASHPTRSTIGLTQQALMVKRASGLEPVPGFYLIFVASELHDVIENLMDEEKKTVNFKASSIEGYIDQVVNAYAALSRIPSPDQEKIRTILYYLTRKEGQSYMEYLRGPQELPLDLALMVAIPKIGGDRLANTLDVLAETHRKFHSQFSLLERYIMGPHKNTENAVACIELMRQYPLELLKDNSKSHHPLRNFLLEGFLLMENKTIGEAKRLRSIQSEAITRGQKPNKIALWSSQSGAVEQNYLLYKQTTSNLTEVTPPHFAWIFDGSLYLSDGISEKRHGVSAKFLAQQHPYGIVYNEIDKEDLGMSEDDIVEKNIRTMEKHKAYGTTKADVWPIRLNALCTIGIGLNNNMADFYQDFYVKGLGQHYDKSQTK